MPNYNRSLFEYDKVLKSTMKRLGVDPDHYSYERDLRNGGLIQFYFNGRHWSYERTKDMMARLGIQLKDGKEAWAQLVLGLQDLVRLHERKVFDFTAGAVVGLKELPPPLPEWCRVMEFDTVPTNVPDVEKRFVELAKYRHPDIKKDDGSAFIALKKALEDAKTHFGRVES